MTQNSQLYVVEKAGHNDGWYVGGQEYLSKISDFMSKSIRDYTPPDFDEWSSGEKFSKTETLLEQESEEASRVKIKTTRMPKGSLEKLKKEANEKKAGAKKGIKTEGIDMKIESTEQNSGSHPVRDEL